jgi:3-oxoacyl-[acyl-carrier protein] reductase
VTADAARAQAIVETIAVGRIGEPADVANAAAFLLDARGGFITDQVVYVCRGMTVGARGR